MWSRDPNTLLNVIVVCVVGLIAVICTLGGITLAGMGKPVPEFVAPVITASSAGLIGYLAQKHLPAAEPELTKESIKS